MPERAGDIKSSSDRQTGENAQETHAVNARPIELRTKPESPHHELDVEKAIRSRREATRKDGNNSDDADGSGDRQCGAAR